LGEDLPICVRISGSEKAPGGLEIQDALDLAQKLEALGANLIHVVTGSNCDSLPWYFQHMALPPGVNEGLAAQIRKQVAIPVMAAGRLGDPKRIREIIAGGTIDMVALGRPLLADPDLPKKMIDGKDDEILLCGHCLQGCFANVKAGKGIGCNINPLVGHELDKIPPADHRKHVAIVGGGPAGMRAALTAHGRGHRITLFEKSTLGGQFALASLSPSKARMRYPLRSLVTQVLRSGIDIQMEQEATCDKLENLAPDAVIMATGSRPSIPDIPGLDDPITGEEILTGSRQAGDRVLVVGGGMIGMEVAEYLAKRDRHVVVVEILEAA
jgi:NADPH-dependent 2,4-dienoyl-CoA reductase/sulfur reductase-like enzyme